jgi:hypothetical protein
MITVVIACFPASAIAQSDPPGNDIFLAPLFLEGNTVTVGRPVNVTARAGYDNQPFFASDESFFFFTSLDTSGQTDIYRYDLESGETYQVTRTPESEYSPTIMCGKQSFSTVRVETGGKQRLWQFNLDGTNPRLVLTAVDSVGYHTWVDDNTLGLFVLGEPHSLRIADKREDVDRIAAFNIGRCLHAVPGKTAVSFVQIVSDDESWITLFDLESGNSRRLVPTLQGSQDFVWIPGGGVLMADGSTLFLWAGDDEWEEVAALGSQGLNNINRLAVTSSGRWLALVADDS